MRPYNRYLITLAVVLPLSTTVLATFGVRQLDRYFSLYVMECLLVTLLFEYLHPRARRVLDRIGYFLLGGFLIIVLGKVAEILLLLPSLR